MEKCKYYNDKNIMWNHGLCFAQKETPPCFSNGNTEKCDIMNSIIPIEVSIPEQSIFTPIDMQIVIDWIRNCDNLKELNHIKEEVSRAIIHFLDPKEDDDFCSRGLN